MNGTTISFDQEEYDPCSVYDPSTYRVTIPADETWELESHVGIIADGLAQLSTYVSLSIYETTGGVWIKTAYEEFTLGVCPQTIHISALVQPSSISKSFEIRLIADQPVVVISPNGASSCTNCAYANRSGSPAAWFYGHRVSCPGTPPSC